MNIIFRTNIDRFKTVSWPVLDVVPRRGEYVYVHPGSKKYCEYNELPTRLEVKQVYYHHDHIEIDLWYSKIDFELFKIQL